MKKIVILCSVIMTAAALLVSAAKEKKPDESSKSTATATEHKIMAPADLQWGEPPPGLPAGAKVAVLNGDPTKAGPFTVPPGRSKARRKGMAMVHFASVTEMSFRP